MTDHPLCPLCRRALSAAEYIDRWCLDCGEIASRRSGGASIRPQMREGMSRFSIFTDTGVGK